MSDTKQTKASKKILKKILTWAGFDIKKEDIVKIIREERLSEKLTYLFHILVVLYFTPIYPIPVLIYIVGIIVSITYTYRTQEAHRQNNE